MFKEEEGGGGILSIQAEQKNVNCHACNLHPNTNAYIGFFNYLFVRSLARSLDIRHTALKVLVF